MAQINCIREMYFEKGMNYASIARATGHVWRCFLRACLSASNQLSISSLYLSNLDPRFLAGLGSG